MIQLGNILFLATKKEYFSRTQCMKKIASIVIWSLWLNLSQLKMKMVVKCGPSCNSKTLQRMCHLSSVSLKMSNETLLLGQIWVKVNWTWVDSSACLLLICILDRVTRAEEPDNFRDNKKKFLHSLIGDKHLNWFLLWYFMYSLTLLLN